MNKPFRWALWGILLVVGGVIAFLLFGLYHQFSIKLSITQAIESSRELKGVAVVNMNRVREESGPFIALSAFNKKQDSELDKLISESNKELIQVHRELRDQEKLAEKPEKALVEKRQAFLEKRESLRQLVDRKKVALNQEYSQVSERIKNKVLAIMEEIAAEMSVPLILNRSIDNDGAIVLYASRGLDVTDRVIKKLNRAQSELNIPS